MESMERTMSLRCQLIYSAILVVGLTLPGRQALGDTLTLRGGKVLEGALLFYDVKANEVKFKLKEGGVLILKRSDVEQIRFVDSAIAPLQVHPDDIERGWILIPGGFAYRNVEFIQQGNSVMFSGELLNRSGASYMYAAFVMTLHDSARQIVRTETFTVGELPLHSTRRFQGFFVGTVTRVEGYRIRFEGGR